jgi:hypothetical protein
MAQYESPPGTKPERPPASNPIPLILLCAALVVLSIILTIVTMASVNGLEMKGRSDKYAPNAPLLPGIMPDPDRPKIILAQDIDYPPYAYLGDATEKYDVDGFGHDVAKGLMEVCDIDVTVVETDWSNCWSSGEIGTGLLNGYYHGCMTYTHTAGERNRFMEFSKTILSLNKAAGIIARLDSSGTPNVLGSDSLAGLNIVDVLGWAPTSDTLALSENSCTSTMFDGFNIIDPTYDTGNSNDDALYTLLNGDADAMWVYADQAKNYKCADDIDETWNCTMWEGLGTTYAYIHTGIYDYAYGGTTLSISKKGSGLADILDPCIEKYILTESYYNTCVENGLTADCFTNSYFPGDDEVTPSYDLATSDLSTSCSTGYCMCP